MSGSVLFEDVNLPGVLYDAGLIDEAIDACGGDLGRRVPLGYAYRLPSLPSCREAPAPQ